MSFVAVRDALSAVQALTGIALQMCGDRLAHHDAAPGRCPSLWP